MNLLRRLVALVMMGAAAAAIGCSEETDEPSDTTAGLWTGVAPAEAVVRATGVTDTGERVEVDRGCTEVVYEGFVREVLYQGGHEGQPPAPPLHAGERLEMLRCSGESSLPFEGDRLESGILVLARWPGTEVGDRWQLELVALEGEAGLDFVSRGGGADLDEEWASLVWLVAFRRDGALEPPARDTESEVALLVAWVEEAAARFGELKDGAWFPEAPGPITTAYQDRGWAREYLTWWALPAYERELAEVPSEVAETLAGVKVLFRVDREARTEAVDLVVRGPLGVSYRGSLAAVAYPASLPARPGDTWEVALAVAGGRRGGTVVGRVPWAAVEGAFAIDLHITAGLVSRVLADPGAGRVTAAYEVAAPIGTADEYWRLVAG